LDSETNNKPQLSSVTAEAKSAGPDTDEHEQAHAAGIPNGETPDPAALAAKVLEEEAKRQAEQQSRDDVTVLPDDLLPGVGGEKMTLREGMKYGGASMLTILFILNIIDEFDRVAVAVLAPDIQNTLNVSDTVLLGVTGLAGWLWCWDRFPWHF